MNQEVSRIQKEYLRRDAEGLSDPYSYANLAFVFHIQEREWSILQALRHEDFNLQGKAVLDVGCGTGGNLHRLLELGAERGVGVDLLEPRVLAGRKRYPTLELTTGNAAQLPYPNASFDVVTQFMCLSSVLDPGMRIAIVNEMWRVLKPGGIVLFYDLRNPSWLYRLLFAVFDGLRKVVGRGRKKSGTSAPPTPIHTFSAREIKDLMSQKSMQTRSVSLNFRLASLAGKSHLLTSLLGACPFLRTHYLVICRKP